MRCPVCYGTNIHKEIFAINDGRAGVKLHYTLCEDCGCFIQWPRVSDALIHQYYASGEYRWSVNQKTAKISIKNIGMEMMRAKFLVEYLVERGIDKPKHVLDFGSSTGLLLGTLRDMFDCQVGGIELDPHHNVFASVYGIECTTSLDYINPGTTFDLITIIHTLEHLPNPREILVRLRDIGTKYLLIEIPNAYYTGMSLNFGHVLAFPYHTLKYLLNATGWKIIDKLYTGLPQFLYSPTALRVLCVATEPTVQHLPTISFRLESLKGRWITTLCKKIAGLPKRLTIPLYPILLIPLDRKQQRLTDL